MSFLVLKVILHDQPAPVVREHECWTHPEPLFSHLWNMIELPITAVTLRRD